MTTFFVTGAGTEIGKTHVACALLSTWRGCGVPCDAFKPVASGFDHERNEISDPGRLASALGKPLTLDSIAAITPWRFRAALAPPLAASAEGRPLQFREIAQACRTRIAETEAEILLIEGAGGVMAPLTQNHTNLDLIADIGAPTIFVAGSYLGAVSHALSGLSVLRSAHIPLAAIVVSESPESVGLAATARMIADYQADAPIFEAERRPDIGKWVSQLSQHLERAS